MIGNSGLKDTTSRPDRFNPLGQQNTRFTLGAQSKPQEKLSLRGRCPLSDSRALAYLPHRY